jgi:hypothetical protein
LSVAALRFVSVKRWIVLFTVLSLPLVAVSCGDDDDAASDTTAAPAAEPACIGQGEAVDGYVGLTEAEAEEKATADGLQLRVVGTDGECAAITMDLREDRVNVELADGVVIAAAIY